MTSIVDQTCCLDVERHFRDSRAATVAAGTSQIQRNLIANLMGLKVQ